MTALIIIGAILLIIFLILMISPAVRIEYAESVKITLKVLFLKFELVGNKPKKQKKKSKPKKSGDEVKHKVEKDVDKKGFAEVFSEYKSEIAPALKKIGRFIHHIRINPLKIRFVIAGKDAADLAIDYGRLCAVFYPALAYLCENMQVGKKEIYLLVDYRKPKAEIAVDTTIKVRLIFAVALAIKLFWQLVMMKIRQNTAENKNITERNAVK